MTQSSMTPSETSPWGAQRQRVVVIGNGGGGKTTLSRAIADATDLPLYEIDQIQYRAGWQVAPPAEVAAKVDEILATDRWIIDGFGPWATIEARCRQCDTLVFVDHPLWVHFWWAAERQIAAVRGEARLGGPEGCPLEDATEKVFRAIGYVHDELRPKIIPLVDSVRGQVDVIDVRSPEELNLLLAEIRGEAGS